MDLNRGVHGMLVLCLWADEVGSCGQWTKKDGDTKGMQEANK